jgi:hypothetical protein
MVGERDVRSSYNVPERKGAWMLVDLKNLVPLQCEKAAHMLSTHPRDSAVLALTSANYEKKRKNYTKTPQSR